MPRLDDHFTRVHNTVETAAAPLLLISAGSPASQEVLLCHENCRR